MEVLADSKGEAERTDTGICLASELEISGINTTIGFHTCRMNNVFQFLKILRYGVFVLFHSCYIHPGRVHR